MGFTINVVYSVYIKDDKKDLSTIFDVSYTPFFSLFVITDACLDSVNQ